ncbi:MAG: isopeptide-forming domain-containing fimbrial protein [Firmicutes bacterium]|nr:isopeptide-forming domain-containing fimbrial protein [Bacillota bacterium]
MKNKFKRIFALIMAMSILMISAAVPIGVSAASDGTITIKAADGDTLEGRSFAIYEIFSATTTTSGDVAYNWYTDASSNNVYYDFFYTGWTDSEGNTYDPWMGTVETNGSITAVINALSASTFTAADLSSFANQLYNYIYSKNYASAGTINPVSTVSTLGSGVTETTVTGLDYGYYLIYDTTSITQSSAMVRSAVLLTSAAPSATATLKADVPELTKLVYTVNNDTANPKNSAYASAMIGDTVTFKVTAYVPDTESFVSGYIYKLTDTLPDGLSYASSLNINITASTSGELTGYNGSSQYSTEDYDYYIDGQNLYIIFPDATDFSEQELTITYDTVLNNSAVQVNTNEIQLDYSYDSTDYTETAELTSTAMVYCFDLQIRKINTSSETLSGAVFNLYHSTSSSAYQSSDDSYWDKIQFIKYAKTVDTAISTTGYITVYLVYDGSATVSDYDYSISGGGTISAELTYDLEADSTTGYIYIEGLGGTINSSQYVEGYYRLVETTAPDGYQLPTSDSFFTLYFGVNASTYALDTLAFRNTYGTGSPNVGSATAGIYNMLGSLTGGTGTYDYNNYAYYSTEFINLTGSTLPSTGGMGTGAFIIGGVVLMALAAGALIFLNKGKGKKA